jgi:flavin-dependent dehydrogenase
MLLRTNRSRTPKVVIVGAGPAGSACALELRRLGSTEVVVVDRATYPRRKVCGSGLSPLALKQLRQLGILDELRDVYVDMTGLRAVGPSGLEVVLQGSKGAWVVPRSELDHRLVMAAVKHGAQLREGTRVTGVLEAPDGEIRGVQTQDGDIEADAVVIANGSPSNFEVDASPRDGIRTIMGWWKGRLPHNVGAMIWDARLGGYYAWAFPEPDEVVNIGITIPDTFERSSRLRELFSEILDDHFREIVSSGEQVGRWMGHPATVTTRVGKVASSRQIFVGEAARLVCPATVEGISFALESGRIAAQTIDRSLDPDRGLSRAAQHRYRLELGTRMLPTFIAGESFYRIMRSHRARSTLMRIVDPRMLASGLSHFVGASSSAH